MKKKDKAMDEEVRPRKRHSKETIEKMRQKRRARTKQPRSGQSKKRQSFYQELLIDYKDNPEAVKWINENKFLMDGGIEQSKDFGVLTEYNDMYHKNYEFCVGTIFFDPSSREEGEVSDAENN